MTEKLQDSRQYAAAPRTEAQRQAGQQAGAPHYSSTRIAVPNGALSECLAAASNLARSSLGQVNSGSAQIRVIMLFFRPDSGLYVGVKLRAELPQFPGQGAYAIVAGVLLNSVYHAGKQAVAEGNVSVSLQPPLTG
jgi:hypothetical protein